MVNLDELNMGDVLEWLYEENGCPVAGGQGIVLKDTRMLVEKLAYSIRTVSIAELIARTDHIRVVSNIFKDRNYKLTIDKKMVFNDGKPVVVNGVIQYE